MKDLMPYYREVQPEDIPKVAPADHKLAIFKLPFTRKLALAWWVKR